jgi:DNA (cytosine-5)-methyltransferase 1
MAFSADYRWDVLTAKGKPPSKRDLVKMTGNAVTPPTARDLIHAVAASLGYGTAA